ncbi:PLAC8 family protein [Actinidia rufa]|uniref:PLAC8 family protein n=1 Tax=Actinidia rufa TaxID=165716 RepID=A0A7J0GK42_9ERIC|nr:PLAC8 family protein [Actinidia rufa]
MANSDESSPLLGNADDEKKATKPAPAPSFPSPLLAAEKQSPPPPPPQAAAYGWTADGLPLGHGSVMGEPLRRSQWDSSLFACLGRNDEFCSSDLEVLTVSLIAREIDCLSGKVNNESDTIGPGDVYLDLD